MIHIPYNKSIHNAEISFRYIACRDVLKDCQILAAAGKPNDGVAGIGASTGLAITLLVYKYFNPSMNPQLQGFNVNQFVKQQAMAVQRNLPNQSGFLPN